MIIKYVCFSKISSTTDECGVSVEEEAFRVTIGRLLCFVGKMCISASYGLVYLIMTEVFATEVTATCVGLITLFSRLGPIVTPFLVKVSQF